MSRWSWLGVPSPATRLWLLLLPPPVLDSVYLVAPGPAIGELLQPGAQPTPAVLGVLAA